MLREFWNIYWKRILGVASGILCGIVYLSFGFWDMLFVALLVFVGYSIGKYKEMNEGPVLPLHRLWEALLDRFRPFK